MFFLFLAYIFGTPDTFGQGNLLITPRRVVFEGNKRVVDLNLANTSPDSATFAISLVQMRMTETGAFEQINEPDPGQLFASNYIRYFPRTVKLGPNESQVVKVQLNRINQLSPGEYRSHFYFRAVPKADPLGQESKTVDTTAIAVMLKPIFGITIPVIIRVGEVSAKITLSDLSLKTINDTIPNITMTFNRSGNSSVYGDIAVYHISKQGKETKVGIANGIAVYTPNSKRSFQFNLNNVPGVDYSSGTLRVVFSAPSDVKPERYAEAELQLN
ncbi:MAG TPA: hypothetical protein VHO46_10325 [Bacteroidales bacterium]|nr:hypothetical protein [Bacteroidales bacterium]